MFSKFFIERPIFAIVLAVLMVLAGALTVFTLPIAQFPEITPPTVSVSATYPGANAETVANTIAEPIEEQVNGVEDMMYMSSSSGSDGSYNLTITFKQGTDPDIAAVKVQDRVAIAEAVLPSVVKEEGVTVMSRSSNIVMFIALESENDEYDELYLTNYAKLNIVDELSRLEGVGEVNAFGAGEYSMRIWLDPMKMHARNLTPADVVAAVSAQNMEVSAGSVGAQPAPNHDPFQITLTTEGRLVTPEEFGNIIIKTGADGQGILRLKDIARLDLGSQTYAGRGMVDGKGAGLLGVYQRPGANALEVAKRVQERMEQLKPYFPKGIEYRVMMNTTEFVDASIDEVLVTFLLTILIVMVVILIFLQNWRAVIIPMLTIPVSLIATFAVMKLLGFSINTLTLFGLVLAIAIVVDDAIVVVEDCARIVDEGKLDKRLAAEKAMKELTGPIVGEVLVLLSVFIPTAFISGITGQLYKQFALTIAVSTAFSGFNALTFTPAMCALFLKKRTKPTTFFFYRWFNKGFGATLELYMRIVGTFLKRPIVAIVAYVVITAAAFYGFVKMPSSYVPEEDMGYFMGSVELPTGASLERTTAVLEQVNAMVKQFPEVDNVMAISGFSFMAGGNGSNLGSLFITLKPWKERKGKGATAEALIEKFNEMCYGIQEAEVFAFNPPAIPGLGVAAGLQMQLLDINNLGAMQLKDALEQVVEASKGNSKIASVTSLYEGEVPQYKLNFNRNKVEMYNLSLGDVFSTLSAYMGGTFINDFNEFGRVYQVNLSADADARARIDDVMKLSIRNSEGSMVPFSSIMTVEPSFGSPTVNRYNMYQTAQLTATPAHGVSSSDGIKAMEELVQSVLGDNYSYAWTGEAYQETQGGVTIALVILFAVVITLLVLAAQYESLTDPVAVIISMPTAILGTVIGCLIMSQSISIYTQIGIILLLGLSAKNAILIVEYAVDFRRQGLDIRHSAIQAGRIRFRPIMMTAMAFVFGVLPMLFATGAGAESRISLGTAVVFGMFINAVVGTLFVPNFWELLERFRERFLTGFLSTPTTALPPVTKHNVDEIQDDI
ncbi:MAG: multidrug efflux RND transporter permease subunit [Muribaculaceae bacterium]|nr:multidrug efflux RND transporter permease subunit [Muribaculaceae bacterium]